LHKIEISEIFADFCLNMVAMAITFDSFKIPIVGLYLNSPTQKILLRYSCEKFLDFCRELNQWNFGLFCEK